MRLIAFTAGLFSVIYTDQLTLAMQLESSTFLVSPPIAGLFFIESLKTKRFSIQEQFYTRSIRISTNWNLTF
ncbi:Uncharacterised protein [Streptococcus pneumoniae]|nr:Uncharacterised protein [Streptococcus pneumoniae]